MRTEKSVKNSIVAIFSSVLITIFGFLLQTVFIKILGEEYLGINGLFNNIISMLAIVELGVGPAIVSNLYRPLAENNIEKIKSLLGYYKKSYNIIGFLVIFIGLAILPFINFFVNTKLVFTNFGGIHFIFLLFIIDASFSYFFAYKRSIIQADQKNRIINITHLICYTLMSLLQILILVLTKNYILFLVIKIIFRITENIILNIIVNKSYSYLKEPTKIIDKEEKNSIVKKVKGLIYHKISGYIVLGTDNLIISKFLGVAVVGLYSNYYLIINSLYTLICQLFSSLTASVGNLLVLDSKEKSYSVYKKIMFLNFWIYGFSATALICMLNPFINVWLGEKYLFTMAVVIILVTNFYMLGMRSSIGAFKDAAGIFYEDRFIPVFESMINIVASIIFVKFFGLFGVFLGTFTSSLIVVFYSLPVYVFKKIFDRGVKEYYILYFKYALVTVCSILISLGLLALFNEVVILNNIIKLVVSAFVSLIIPNLLFIIIFRQTEEFNYFKNFLLSKLRKGC